MCIRDSTKAVAPQKWEHALDLINIKDCTFSSGDTVPASHSVSPHPLQPETLEINIEPKSAHPAALSTPAKHPEQGWKAMSAIATDLIQVKRRIFGATIKQVQNMKRAYALSIRYYRGKPKCVRSHRPSGKLPGWGKFIELCTSPDSMLGKTALEFGKRITAYRVTQ
eukprot:11381675-Karenia_brevis.AAC.1